MEPRNRLAALEAAKTAGPKVRRKKPKKGANPFASSYKDEHDLARQEYGVVGRWSRLNEVAIVATTAIAVAVVWVGMKIFRPDLLRKQQQQ